MVSKIRRASEAPGASPNTLVAPPGRIFGGDEQLVMQMGRAALAPEHGRSQSLGPALAVPRPSGGASTAVRHTASAPPYLPADVAWGAARASLLCATSHGDTVRSLRRLHDFPRHWQADAAVRQRLVKLLDHSQWTIVVQAARHMLSDAHLSLTALAELGDRLKIDQMAEAGRRLLTEVDGTSAGAPTLRPRAPLGAVGYTLHGHQGLRQ